MERIRTYLDEASSHDWSLLARNIPYFAAIELVFEADDLFVPRTNISLGAGYLAELSNQFDGRLSASIASYNAGPEAVREWISEVEVEDAEDRDDEWVESIPYEQTRNYVKRVLRSLYVYRTLY